MQNTSAFWELLGAITAINPPREAEQAALYASWEPLGLSLNGFGFDPNNLTAGAALCMLRADGLDFDWNSVNVEATFIVPA